VLLQDQWLFETEWPGKDNPVVVNTYAEIPGKIFGIGLVQPLIDLQRLYNRMQDMIMDMTELMSNPVWLIPTNAGINNADISNAPGTKIRYSPAGKPERVAGSAVPQHMYENLRSIDAQMMDVSGVHSNSEGRRSAGDNSGVAIEQLVEKDTSQLAQTKASINRALTMVAKVVLCLMKTYYTEPRMVKIFGSDGPVVWRELSSTDLSENPSIHIEADSLFQDEIANREKKLWNAVQMQAITPQEAYKRSSLRTFDQDRMAKLMEYSHANDLLNAAKSGQDIMIFPQDDLEAIGEVFKNYMRSPEFYQPHVMAVQSGNPQAIRATGDAMIKFRDIYIALSLPPQASAQDVQAIAAQMIWPRMPAPMLGAEPNPPGNPNPQTGPKSEQQKLDQQRTAQAVPASGEALTNGMGTAGAIG